MSKKINHKERDHALLSASASDRWTVCTPSARLAEKFPDTTSEAAAEGTLAHEMAELKVRKYFIEPMPKSTFTRRLNKMKKHELFKDEMLGFTDDYLDLLKEIALKFDTQPYVTVERQVDYSHYAPEGFGTVDCLMIHGDTLFIIDFKYGRNKAVDATETLQPRLYALGALKEYSFLYPIKQVKMIIFQPRNPIGTTMFTMTTEELTSWGESIKPLALQAFDGEGDLVPGNHCGFCPAKPLCRAQAAQFDQVVDHSAEKPESLSFEEVATYLSLAGPVETWIKALKAYAVSSAIQGEEVPGYKLVEGRKGRGFTDMDAAFAHLQAKGVPEAQLYDRVPLTLPKVEKVIGKKDYTALLVEAGFVKQLPGKPTLVEETDKRPAITVTPDAKSDFNIEK